MIPYEVIPGPDTPYEPLEGVIPYSVYAGPAVADACPARDEGVEEACVIPYEVNPVPDTPYEP